MLVHIFQLYSDVPHLICLYVCISFWIVCYVPLKESTIKLQDRILFVYVILTDAQQSQRIIFLGEATDSLSFQEILHQGEWERKDTGLIQTSIQPLINSVIFQTLDSLSVDAKISHVYFNVVFLESGLLTLPIIKLFLNYLPLRKKKKKKNSKKQCKMLIFWSVYVC